MYLKYNVQNPNTSKPERMFLHYIPQIDNEVSKLMFWVIADTYVH